MSKTKIEYVIYGSCNTIETAKQVVSACRNKGAKVRRIHNKVYIDKRCLTPIKGDTLCPECHSKMVETKSDMITIWYCCISMGCGYQGWKRRDSGTWNGTWGETNRRENKQ